MPSHTSTAPGRVCPVAYRYGAAALDRAADLRADTLYVAGGLYGNPFALDALTALAAREPGARLVFNGDFHWFDIDDATFVYVSEAVLAHATLRGNVETELLSEDAAAGCGCGYPDQVSDTDVARSNAIMARLSATAQRHRALAGRLAGLPMHLVAQVGGLRVGIVHGDADSLAGWRFGEDALDTAYARASFTAARVRVFASSHTCLPVAQVFDTPAGPSMLINNGAAGMPNFTGTACGLATRIATTAAPAALGALYGARIDGVHVDAVPLHYDATAWLAQFDRNWPVGSPAAESYRRRIIAGPSYACARAPRAGVTAHRSARAIITRSEPSLAA